MTGAIFFVIVIFFLSTASYGSIYCFMNRTRKGPFTIKDAKKVFPGLADGVVQKWRDKGYVVGNAVKRGLSVEIQYDIYQLVHINVINQLSLLGVFQRNVSNLTVYVEPLSDYCSLTEPHDIEQILNVYAKLDARAILSVDIAEEPLDGANYRNRRAIVKYLMRLGDMDTLFPPDTVNLGTFFGPNQLTYTTAQIRVGMMLVSCLEVLTK